MILLGAVACAVLALFVAVLLLVRAPAGDPARSAEAALPASPTGDGAPSGVPAGPAPDQVLVPATEAGSPADEPPSRARVGGAAPPEGFGLLRGSVEAEGLDFPQRWNRQIESRPGSGAEPLAPMRVDHAAGERTFAVELPFGAWEVRALCPGAASPGAPARLSAERPDAELTLRLLPAGILRGQVVDELKTPLEGIAVAARAIDGRVVAEARTGPDGWYELRGLLDGEHHLHVGGVERPLVQPLPVSYRGPSVLVPTVVLAKLGSARIRVLDEDGRPVPGASLRGQGEAAGELEAVADENGRALVSHLVQGSWRVHAQDERGGRGNRVFLVAPGERAEVEVHLRRPLR